MSALGWLVLGLGALVLLPVLATLSYGRFAAQSLGAPGLALSVERERTEIDRAFGPLTERHGGESGLLILGENVPAFRARLHAARSAGRSLDLQYYYWKNDVTGRLLAREVLQAADRGVRVRVLLDDISSKSDVGALGLDSHPHIEVRLFNPSQNRPGGLRRGLELLFRPWSSTRRMHNKAWIADGRVAIVGGRNIGDSYFDASKVSNFRDLDVLMIGAAVAQAERLFDDYWNSPVVIPVHRLGETGSERLQAVRAYLEVLARDEHAAPFLRVAEGDDATRTGRLAEASFRWTRGARVIADPPLKARGGGAPDWLSQSIFELIVPAKRLVRIISPYFVPGSAGVERLSELTSRGVAVSVLTNSLAATDVAAVHGGYSRYRKALLRGGIELYELKPDETRKSQAGFGSSTASLHTKAFTVDDAWGFVGSFNFDPRSASLNTEMGVVFDDPELISAVRAHFDRHAAGSSSYRLRLEGDRLIWDDGSPSGPRDEEPEAGAWRRFLAFSSRILPIESQL